MQSSVISPQAFTCVIAYCIVGATVFLPTLSYEKVDFKRRVKWFLAILLGGAAITMTINCMIFGSCLEWAWTMVFLVALLPSFLGVIYIFFSNDVEVMYKRLQEIILS